MIAFATLFLGMVFGIHPVEVLVSAEVAAVEIRLDGVLKGRIESEPWRIACDFGELEPHELVAVGYDAGGNELQRIRQWINLPQPGAQIGIVLEEDGQGGIRGARLSWESTVGADPLAIDASLDGEPLSVEDPRRIVLPPTDTSQIHFLRVRLDFGSGVSAVEELTFGGPFSDQASSEMTAILVRSKKRPKVSDLDGLLTVDGETLEVIGVEQGPAEVIVVVDRAIFEKELPRYMSQYLRQPAVVMMQRQRQNRNYQRMMQEEMGRVVRLRKNESFRLMWPVAELQRSSSGSYEVFSSSPPTDEGLLLTLAGIDLDRLLPGDQRLADAVAAAARTASRDRHRRAVVLQLSLEAQDSSRLTPERVRHYLAKLQVPLHVWRSEKRSSGPTSWGETEPTSSIRGFQKAGHRLQDDLDEQWIVWVADLHLPHRVSLQGKGHGIRLIDDDPDY